jgi:hypothetical protein
MFVLVPISALQIFEELGLLVDEEIQAPLVYNVLFKLTEIIPEIVYFKCKGSSVMICNHAH